MKKKSTFYFFCDIVLYFFFLFFVGSSVKQNTLAHLLFIYGRYCTLNYMLNVFTEHYSNLLNYKFCECSFEMTFFFWGKGGVALNLQKRCRLKVKMYVSALNMSEN